MPITIDIEGTIIQNFPEEFMPLVPILTSMNRTIAEVVANASIGDGFAAEAITFTPGAGSLVSEDVQAALDELDGITVAISDGITDANYVTTLASGKKIAFGTATPNAASFTVVTGLAAVEQVFGCMVGAPSLTHMWTSASIGNQSGAPAAGSILILTYKPTASGDVTPIAATTPWSNVYWLAIGS